MGDKFSVWKRHFENQARGLIPRDSEFYKVSSHSYKNEEKGGSQIPIISPSQQIVERAKSQLKQPDSIYDPVTGIMHHSRSKPRSVQKGRKKSSQGKIHKKKKVRKNKPKKKCTSKKKKNCRGKKRISKKKKTK